MAATRAQIVAVFARERDRTRAVPHGRILKRLEDRSVHVSAGLTAQGAIVGAVLAAVVTPLFAWIVGRIARESAPRPLLLAAVAGGVGALLGAIVVRRGAAAFAREINGHLARGRVVSLVEADRSDATAYCQRIEAQGALEALTLPTGLEIAQNVGELVPFGRFVGERQEDEGFGATIIAGHAELATAATRLEDAGVRVAFIGRTGHAGPVHSSTAGPAWVHAPVPEGGEGWWHGLVARYGRPIHLRLADGELVLLGDARRIGLILSGHRNDTISSGLARLAERFACPDASARIVVDRIDGGGVGLLVFGPRDARRHVVERLSTFAIASSEGASVESAERGAA